MLLRVGGKETFGGWSSCLLTSLERSNTCLLYERGAKRESSLSTTPSPAGGGLYKDSCPTALFLLENIASTCSLTVAPASGIFYRSSSNPWFFGAMIYHSYNHRQSTRGASAPPRYHSGPDGRPEWTTAKFAALSD
jgi:hypothetical protein